MDIGVEHIHLIGKRKKKIKQYPNPLFLKWLNQWKEDAASKGCKSQYNYKKAISSLKKYPLPMQSGKECKILDGFGDKTCAMLDRKLQEHIAMYGTTSLPNSSDSSDESDVDSNYFKIKIPTPPEATDPSCSTVNISGTMKKPHRKLDSAEYKQERKRRRSNFCGECTGCNKTDDCGSCSYCKDKPKFGGPGRQKQKCKLRRCENVSLPRKVLKEENSSVDDIMGNINRSNSNEQQVRVRERLQSGPRDYIPQFRSGPYAILITLFNQTEREGLPHLSKKDLMRLAQPLADKSFTMPDPGCRYTAWSSMGTLIKKGLVVKDSSPAKYHLSYEGKLLAERMLRGEMQGANLSEKQNSDENLRFTIGTGPTATLKSVSDETNSCLSNQVRSAGNITTQNKTKEAIDLSDFDDSDLDKPGLLHRIQLKNKNVKSSYKKVQEPVDASIMVDDSSGDTEIRNLNRFEDIHNTNNDIEVIDHCDPQFVGVKDLKSESNIANFGGSGLKFIYITDSGSETLHKDKATVTIDDDIGLGFLVKASYEDLLLSGKLYKLDSSRHSTGTDIFAYLCDDDAPDRANPQKSDEQKNVHSTSASSQFKPANNKDVPISSSHTVKETEKLSASTSFKVVKKVTSSTTVNVVKKAKKNVESEPKITITPVLESENSQSSVFSVRSIPSRTDSQKSIASLTSESQDTDSQPLPVPDFTLSPGTFEVVLIMDNREVFGAGASKDTLVTELKKNKVPLEVRPLSIGDFVWIARKKTGIFHTVNKAEELVLDYIIERKRMDDLASSIVDGRFKEQKFRLTNCGLRKPIYLVEDYGSVQHFSINQDALNQAVVNTQIIDNFYIKRTRDVKESVAYLTILTRYLQGLYSHKSLHAGSKRDIEHETISPNVQDLELRLITYQEFDKMSVKTRKLTVQETFGKHLVQINGVTVDKAAAIVEKYKTPQSLIETYKKCSTEKEKQSLLTAIKFGPLNRGIGAQLSKVIYWLYSRNTLL